jgi:hypothetical protein
LGDSSLVSPVGIKRGGREGLLGSRGPLPDFSCGGGTNKSGRGGRMFSFVEIEEVNISLRRRLRGFSFGAVMGASGGRTESVGSLVGGLVVVVERGRLEGRGVELLVAVGRMRLSHREEGGGSAARDESDIPMSSRTISSSSESDASVSETTRGDPTNGASNLNVNPLSSTGR